MKRKSARRNQPGEKSSWDPNKWLQRCAWCTQRIPANQEVFGIEIRLRPEAFKEFDPGTVQPLLLAMSGRTVPMMIVSEDSPAKKAGKDALFQVCSETCAVNLHVPAILQDFRGDALFIDGINANRLALTSQATDQLRHIQGAPFSKLSEYSRIQNVNSRKVLHVLRRPVNNR